MMTKLITKESDLLIFKNKYYLKNPTYKDINKVNIDIEEAHRLKHWALINGTYYFVKHASMLNEMIGEIIAREMHLNTAHYEPVNYFESLAYISPNFRDRDKEYHKIEYYINNKSEDALDDFSKIITKPNFDVLKLQVLKMWALDIFMRQLDRCSANIMIEESNSGIQLAPLFDYSAAYMTSINGFKKYENGIRDIEILNIKAVFEKYPELIDIMGELTDKDILKKLKEELEKYNLNFHTEIKKYYQNEFDGSKKAMTKMIGR